MIRLPHLETNVTVACNLRCLHCNHFVALQADLAKATMVTPEGLAEDLKHFSRVAHVDGYAMIGGEPTLHPALPELIQVAKDSGVADSIEVWTNGKRLTQSARFLEFWESPFDELVVSAYPGILTDQDLNGLANDCDAFGKKMRLIDERHHPNFTPILKKTPGRAQETYDVCWFKTYSRVLERGYFWRCCTSPFIPKLLLNLPDGTDGLKVDANLTEDMLQSFLDQPTAMASCGPCAGRSTKGDPLVAWGEERDPVKWLEKSRVG